MSSAYRSTRVDKHTEGKSLMYKINSNGPKIDPCGIPMLLVARVDLDVSIWTN